MRAKQLGAYYTEAKVAGFLVSWAIRASTDKVLDPSFGGGVFLRQAIAKIGDLGGDPSLSVYGVDLDESLFTEISQSVNPILGLPKENAIHSDFFSLPSNYFQVEAVVGNPPFIRFHRFAGEERARALLRAKQNGVNLSGLSSSWAPFIVHSLSMLKAGGRIAMVVPAEIVYASYAAPLLNKLCQSFDKVSLLSFRTKIFQDLNEDTMLLLGEGFGGTCCAVNLADFKNTDAIRFSNNLIGGADMNSDFCSEDLVAQNLKIGEVYLPRASRTLYRELENHPLVRRLGQTAKVGIGYVTGANNFFHLNKAEVERLGIPHSFLRKTVTRGRALRGLWFDSNEWERAEALGQAGYLLQIIDSGEELPKSICEYLKAGEISGIPLTYKCRNRQLWYSVPVGPCPDGLLTYMSGNVPRLVFNDTSVLASNTLHGIQLISGYEQSMRSICCGWQTSHGKLTAEIEGHAMGGGMLKIEPGEAKRLLVMPCIDSLPDGLANQLDSLVKAGNEAQAEELANEELLIKILGVKRQDVRLLHDAARNLAHRRCSKGAAA